MSEVHVFVFLCETVMHARKLIILRHFISTVQW